MSRDLWSRLQRHDGLMIEIGDVLASLGSEEHPFDPKQLRQQAEKYQRALHNLETELKWGGRFRRHRLEGYWSDQDIGEFFALAETLSIGDSSQELNAVRNGFAFRLGSGDLRIFPWGSHHYHPDYSSSIPFSIFVGANAGVVFDMALQLIPDFITGSLSLDYIEMAAAGVLGATFLSAITFYTKSVKNPFSKLALELGDRANYIVDYLANHPSIRGESSNTAYRE